MANGEAGRLWCRLEAYFTPMAADEHHRSSPTSDPHSAPPSHPTFHPSRWPVSPISLNNAQIPSLPHTILASLSHMYTGHPIPNSIWISQQNPSHSARPTAAPAALATLWGTLTGSLLSYTSHSCWAVSTEGKAPGPPLLPGQGRKDEKTLRISSKQNIKLTETDF